MKVLAITAMLAALALATGCEKEKPDGFYVRCDCYQDCYDPPYDLGEWVGEECFPKRAYPEYFGVTDYVNMVELDCQLEATPDCGGNFDRVMCTCSCEWGDCNP